MASNQPGGLTPGTSIFEQAEKILEEQSENSARIGAVEDHGKVGVEAGAKGAIGRGWSWRAWVAWWKGEKQPTVYGGVEKKW